MSCTRTCTRCFNWWDRRQKKKEQRLQRIQFGCLQIIFSCSHVFDRTGSPAGKISRRRGDGLM